MVLIFFSPSPFFSQCFPSSLSLLLQLRLIFLLLSYFSSSVFTEEAKRGVNQEKHMRTLAQSQSE